MKRNALKAGMFFAILLTLTLAVCALPSVARAQGDTIYCWVEAPGNQGDPGDPTADPAALENFVLYKTQEGGRPESFLRTDELGRRFAHLISNGTAEDGTVNAYYARGLFCYEFDVYNLLGEMTIADITYTGGGSERYTVFAKYEQSIVFPGFENGLMPVIGEPEKLDAYCAGWLLDERVGDKRLLTQVSAVSESMLPTDDMPYEDLTFTLTAAWFEGNDSCVLACWYEELPAEAKIADLNRMSYGGKTYVNYPATDCEINLPKGSKPGVSSAPGVKYVTTIEPSGGDNRWQYVYDRERFTLSFDSGGAGSLNSHSGILYQQNLGDFDPGWDAATTRTQGGKTYKFMGWYQGESFISFSVGAMYMPPFDLKIVARWEAQD